MPDRINDSGIERELKAWADSVRDARPAAETLDEIARALASANRPVTPLPSTWLLIAACLAIFAACTSIAITAMSFAGLHLMVGAREWSMAAVFTGAAILFALTMCWRMIPGSRFLVPFGAVLAISSIAVAAAMAILFPWQTSAHFISDGWLCAAMEAVVALPAGGLLWLIARRGAPSPSFTLGAAVAGLAVLVAMAVVQFQCMSPQTPHLWVWHACVGAGLVLAGGLIGTTKARHARN